MASGGDKLLPSRPPTRASEATADTESWEDGAGGALSPNSGGGVAPMQRFMRDHMRCILAPIGEHVSELDVRMRALQHQLLVVDSKAERSRQRLAEQADEIGALQRGAQDTSADQAALREDASRTAEQLAALQAGGAGQQEALAKLEGVLDSTRDSVQALREALEDTDASVARLQLQQWEAENLAGRAQSGVDGLRASAAASEKDQEARSRAQRGAAEELRRDLEALREALERQSRESAEAIGVLERWREEASRLLAGACEAAEHHGREPRAQGAAAAVAPVAQPSLCAAPVAQPSQGAAAAVALVAQPSLGAAPAAQPAPGAVVAAQSAPQSRRGSDVGSLGQRVRKVEDDLQRLSSEVARELPPGLLMRVDRIDSKLQKNISECEKVSRVAEALRRTDEAVANAQDRIARIELRTGVLESKAERMEERAGLLEARAEGLARQGREDRRSIDEHQDALEDADERHGELQRTVAGALGDLRALTAGLGETKEAVAEQGALLDLAHEYIQGLGCGVQDTHRQVLGGAGGMLPPMSARGSERAMPGLPRPRPMSSGARRVRVPHE